MKCGLCLQEFTGNIINCGAVGCPGLNIGFRAPSRDPLLVEREKTHGSFQVTAAVAQALKSALNFDRLDKRQCEALDMICSKIARIVSGNANEVDHWNDIAGYAKLGAEACEQ